MEIHEGSYSLGEDNIKIILSKLPVKSLMRFKYDSKRWFALITTDSYLITTHLHHSNTTKLCILSGIVDDEEKSVYNMLLLHDESSIEELELDHQLVDQIFGIVGSSNGLVYGCLWSDSSLYAIMTNIVLWNLVIKALEISSRIHINPTLEAHTFQCMA